MTRRFSLSSHDANVDSDFATSSIFPIDETRSRSREVISSPHDFAGLFSIKDLCRRFDDPVLVSNTGGVGSKILAAITCQRHDNLGQDLVAMCANDISAKGAEPLYFLDYFASSHLKTLPFHRILNGIASSCDEINCALVGGETSEMPGLYEPHHFDLAGFIVGVLDRSKILGAHRVHAGDVVIGLPSNGLHASGFNLVRKIMFNKLQHRANDVLWETEKEVCTVANELLRPTRLYVNHIKLLIAHHIDVHAIAHITDGGIVSNILRVLPAHLQAQIDLRELEQPRIFNYLQQQGQIVDEEMLRTFNMGIGLAILLAADQVQDALTLLRAQQENAWVIGEIIGEQEGKSRCIVTR